MPPGRRDWGSLSKKRSCGTPTGSGPQSQIAVAQLSHEASLHKRSAEPLWRLGSAIHGSANFLKAPPHTRLSSKLWCTQDRKSTRLNSSHVRISYAVFCLKKKKKIKYRTTAE